MKNQELIEGLNQAQKALWDKRQDPDHWEGCLSSSALSTATAICALALFLKTRSHPESERIKHLILRGRDWLTAHANEDGGWGDTILSLSNISTTTLVWASYNGITQPTSSDLAAMAKAENWLVKKAGAFTIENPQHLTQAIILRYGKDRTFSVPILTMCALSGRFGEGQQAWKQVIQLPFELAALPMRFFAFLQLPVVSYALPALIAIGLVRHKSCPTKNPILRWLRHVVEPRILKILDTIQPVNGGFLEATPLTSFVLMSLCGAGHSAHPVADRAVEFLIASADKDGSWPIDTHLATWTTTLSINALGTEFLEKMSDSTRKDFSNWILAQQYQDRHPYTNAAPGGWAWTPLPGGVPDADDTPGALLALYALDKDSNRHLNSAIKGIEWLLGLQNNDGGIPTFCKGWGALPFDQSSPDLTAHTLRAWSTWMDRMPGHLQTRILRAQRKALRFLLKNQSTEGFWIPLWFGNQHVENDLNPVYGTTRVMLALVHEKDPEFQHVLVKALTWLLHAQNSDGGWGGSSGVKSSTEETAMAVETLSLYVSAPGFRTMQKDLETAWSRGYKWLLEAIRSGMWTAPSPIGFYFARLWYYEELYPMIFTVAALEKASTALKKLQDEE